MIVGSFYSKAKADLSHSRACHVTVFLTLPPLITLPIIFSVIVCDSIISFLNKHLNITLFLLCVNFFFPFLTWTSLNAHLSAGSVCHICYLQSPHCLRAQGKRSYILHNSKELAKVEEVNTMHKHWFFWRVVVFLCFHICHVSVHFTSPSLMLYQRMSDAYRGP